MTGIEVKIDAILRAVGGEQAPIDVISRIDKEFERDEQATSRTRTARRSRKTPAGKSGPGGQSLRRNWRARKDSNLRPSDS